MAGKPKTDKVVASDVTVSIGIISMLGDLQTVLVPNVGSEEKLSTVCPECSAPTTFMKSQLVCTENGKHTPQTIASADRGKMVDGKLVKVDKAAVQEARKSVLPVKEINLQVHPAAEIAASTLPLGGAYRFVPKGKSTLYPVLLQAIQKSPEVAFVAKVNLRNNDHLVQVDVERGELMVRELAWPEDVKTFEPVDVGDFSAADIDKQGKLLTTLIDAVTEPFDAAEYSKDSRQRISSVVDEAIAGTGATPKKVAKVKAKESMQSLEDAITAALQAKKAS